MKIILTTSIISCFLIVTSCISMGNSCLITNPGDESYFENVDVLLFGRCRSIFSFDDTWLGGLVVGDLEYCGASNTNQPFERFDILIKNLSSGEIFLKLKLQYHTIQFLNASGVFFWGAKGSGGSIFPPIIFIKCHAEKLAISEGPWDD